MCEGDCIILRRPKEYTAGLICAEQKSAAEILFLQHDAVEGAGFTSRRIYRVAFEQAGGGADYERQRVASLIGHFAGGVNRDLVGETFREISVGEPNLTR